MKQLTQTFNEIQESNPNLSSFICFGRAVGKCKSPSQLIRRAFSKLVDRQDYSKTDLPDIYKHFSKARS